MLFHFEGGAISKEQGRNGKVRDMLTGGQLVEVELQYEQDGWDEEKYGACLSEKRQMLERLYGPGQQLVRSSTPTPDGKATQTLVGYKWNRNNTAVELIYFRVAVDDGRAGISHAEPALQALVKWRGRGGAAFLFLPKVRFALS